MMELYTNLGDKLRSVVTGFEGVAISRVEYLNGCQRFEIQPPIREDGTLPESHWIDIQELELVEGGAVSINPTMTGGGKNPPKR